MSASCPDRPRPSLLRRLRAHRDGNVAMIFAIALPLLVGGTGIAVDMNRIFAANILLQRSLDAASLAAAKEVGRNQPDSVLRQVAESYFYANAGRISNEPTQFNFLGVRKDRGNTVVEVSATRELPLYFGRAIGELLGGDKRGTVQLEKSSQVVVQNRSIEMALVLDTSGSMKDPPAGGGTAKIVTLRSATTDLVNQMMVANNSNVEYPVSVSVVPFAASVNVGSTNENASWMDTLGVSPGHHDDFDWTTYLVPGTNRPLAETASTLGGTYWRRVDTKEALTRFYLYKFARGTGVPGVSSWEGCIASRPNGYAVTDDAPTQSRPATLFFPMFAPSEYYWTDSRLGSRRNMWIDNRDVPAASNDQANLNNQRNMERYFSTRRLFDDGGPNSGCTSNPLTPLTKTRSTVTSAISALQPSGGTNIMEGLAWGWRTLSANEPFPQGRPAYTPDNLKVIVLMTDGDNTYNASYSNGQQVEIPSANKSEYGTYGYAQFVENGRVRTGRMFDSTTATTKAANIASVTAAMNENLLKACQNAKADGRNPDGSDGIVIFTIAFDLKDGSPVKELLRQCASSGMTGRGEKLYYDARSSADLLIAFRSITDEISSLRIAK